MRVGEKDNLPWGCGDVGERDGEECVGGCCSLWTLGIGCMVGPRTFWRSLQPTTLVATHMGEHIERPTVEYRELAGEGNWGLLELLGFPDFKTPATVCKHF